MRVFSRKRCPVDLPVEAVTRVVDRKRRYSAQRQRRSNSKTWYANASELKCDTNTPCARCSRLKIPCTGGGQQRYKFQDETKKFESGSAESGSIVNPVTTLARKPWVVHLPRQPSNAMTKLTLALIDKANLRTDVRYDIVPNFGPFLVLVPCRLGTNPAMDAASDALVAAHTSFCSANISWDKTEVFTKYSYALKALRETLSDPSLARSSETLGAIWLLMIVQV